MTPVTRYYTQPWIHKGHWTLAQLVLTLTLLTILTQSLTLIFNLETHLDIIASLYFFQEKSAVKRKYFSGNILIEKGLFTLTYFLTKIRKMSLRHQKLLNSLTHIFKNPTSHVLQPALILAQFLVLSLINANPYI